MPSPLARCRTLYIGSAVPTVTKDGLQGIQEPLRERYPVNQSLDTRGIDSWLSVWSNGLLLEYAAEAKEESRFFPIQSLHYCAAVRYVNVAGYEIEGGGERFLPLDSPFAAVPNGEPPIFAAILRRTSGIKVLECHAFICTNPKAANALVAACFRAYADSVQMKGPETPLETEAPSGGTEKVKAIKAASSRSSSPEKELDNGYVGGDDSASDKEILRWSEASAQGKPPWQRRQQAGDVDAASLSSSLAGRYRKRERVQPPPAAKQPRTRSELGGARSAGGTMLPPNRRQANEALMYRRSNSDANLLAASGATMPRGGSRMAVAIPGQHPMMPPPHFRPHPMMGPPPMGPPMMGPMGPMGPPPHMMMGPPPPGMMGPPPPQGMMPPPPPPHMLPPHVMYGEFGPPPGMMPPPEIYGTLRPGTMRRREEPLYGPVPPEASYNPAAFHPSEYEAFSETLGRRRPGPQWQPPPPPETLRRGDRRAESLGGRNGGPPQHQEPEREEAGSLYWDASVYEGGIYRRQPYLNEKAFGGASVGRFGERPPSPPIDYDAPRRGMNGQSRRMEEDFGRMSVEDSMYGRPSRVF